MRSTVKSAHSKDNAQSNMECFVYWIHLRFETNPFLDGYVGVTEDIERRWRRHKRHAILLESKRNTFPLYRAFRKHGVEAFQFDVLAGPLDKWSAHNLEYALRPHSRIGYNLALGGYWRSCLACCTLSPARLSVAGAKLINERIEKVSSDQRPPEPLERLAQATHEPAAHAVGRAS